MFNKQAKEEYQINYFIRLNDGDIVQVVKPSSTATHLPKTACVSVFNNISIKLANESKCKIN